MRLASLSAGCLSILALAGCATTGTTTTTTTQTIAGSLAGAAVGALTAEALNADDEWILLAGLGGAAAGALVARNAASGDCAYANGDGTYRVAACPS